MNKWMQNKYILTVLSLVLSIMLFAYAREANPTQRVSSVSTGTTTSNTISNVPVYVDVDSTKYVVSGLPESVLLRVEGSSSALLALSGNNAYRVKTPDLNELGAGNHTISLEVTGLPSGVTAIVSPMTAEIVIENKKTVELPVTIQVDASKVTNGYQIGTATASPASVKVTAAESVINQIEQVQATLVIPENTRSDLTSGVEVAVLDVTGTALNVELDPVKVQVRVPIAAASKDVPLVLTSTGSAGSTYVYDLTTDTSTVKLLGPQEVLDSLFALPLVVDVSQVTASTSQELTLSLPAGVDAITPEKVTVQIDVTNLQEETTQASTTTETTTQEATTNSVEETTSQE